MIGYCNFEFRRLTGENRIDTGESNFEPHEVALALVHRYEANANKKEGQDKRQVVVVVHRSQQHRKCHQAEYQSNTRRQDVNTSGFEARYALSRPDVSWPSVGRASAPPRETREASDKSRNVDVVEDIPT